jgi:hypothetical protein
LFYTVIGLPGAIMSWRYAFIHKHKKIIEQEISDIKKEGQLIEYII